MRLSQSLKSQLREARTTVRKGRALPKQWWSRKTPHGIKFQCGPRMQSKPVSRQSWSRNNPMRHSTKERAMTIKSSNGSCKMALSSIKSSACRPRRPLTEAAQTRLSFLILLMFSKGLKTRKKLREAHSSVRAMLGVVPKHQISRRVLPKISLNVSSIKLRTSEKRAKTKINRTHGWIEQKEVNY